MLAVPATPSDIRSRSEGLDSAVAGMCRLGEILLITAKLALG
jgi:hypothetical protein